MNQLIVRGGLLIDGTGRPPIEKAAVLIEGDRIVAVGAKDNIKAAPEAMVLDCGDEVLIPGMIDCHSHCSLDITLENSQARILDSDAEQALRASFYLSRDIKAGVTTVRCLGDVNFVDVACKRSIESGRLRGPRLLVATRGIRATHAHGLVGHPCDGPEAIRRMVRENIRAGADVIKLFITPAVRGKGEIPNYFSKEEISLAVQEGRRVGVPTAAHCVGGNGFDECIEAGVHSIEHGYFISDHQIDLLLKSNRWLVLTPSPFFAEERYRRRTQEAADNFRRWRDTVAERMTAAIRGGVKFGVGTDVVHGGVARELEYLVQYGGASESQAIVGVTKNAAAVLGLDGSVGTLEPGKVADLVSVKGNPLKDIRALQSVMTVISRGSVVSSGARAGS